MQKIAFFLLAASLLFWGCEKQQEMVPEKISFDNIEVPYYIHYKKRELRAVWVASVANIDWPSEALIDDDEHQKREFIKLLDDVKRWGMNAVIVQVRPTADTFYPSSYEPWSKFLTGKQGRAPAYNPLAFMIEEAHKRNLEFHAWFNPFRVRRFKENKLSKNHPAFLYPDWIVEYNNQLYYNPGNPEVRAFSLKAIMEVVKHYDIDAVHMDDYFYPYTQKDSRGNPVPFPDQAEYRRYGKSKYKNIDDWRRSNVNDFVRTLSRAIKKEKSYVKFGISPFGVWRNKADDKTGSHTTAGQTNYDNLYANTREWIRKGYLDYIMPQIYWNFGFKPAAYEVLVKWWRNEIKDTPNIHLYIGHGAYKIGQKGWEDPGQLPMQIRYNRKFENISGSALFSYIRIKGNKLNIQESLTGGIFKYPALIPPMAWLKGKTPSGVTGLKAGKIVLKAGREKRGGVRLSWVDMDNNNTCYYAVYRLPGEDAPLEAKYLAATVRKSYNDEEVWDDFDVKKGTTYYVVTALDRLHNESPMCPAVKIKKGLFGILIHH